MEQGGTGKEQRGRGWRRMAGKTIGKPAADRNVEKEGGRTKKGRENGEWRRSRGMQKKKQGGRGISIDRIGETARLLAGHG